jgi:hypothetical protein
VDNQNGVGVARVLYDVFANVVADCLSVPLGPCHEVLQAVRCGVLGMLGDGPATLPRQAGQQSHNERPCPASGFGPRETARDPAHKGIEHVPPASQVHAIARGQLLIFVCPHSTR